MQCAILRSNCRTKMAPKRGAANSASAAKKRRLNAAGGSTISAGALAAAMKRYGGGGVMRTGGFYGRYSGRNAEQKFFDTTLNFLMDATGEVPATGQLCLIPQGVTESQRVGRKCVIKSILIKAIALYSPAAGADPYMTGEILVVLDKQCNGAAAAITDVLTGTQVNTALHNLANSQRFVVLKRIKIGFNPTAGVTTAYAGAARKIDWYKKCNIPIEFSSTTGAIGEIKSNNIFLLAGSSTAGDDLVTVSGTCRLRFSDN
nr:MAG TPA: capsid protein [Cressdnaviricota sp.]